MITLRYCKDCSNFSYCVFCGYTEDSAAKLACDLYQRVWWKFWRPS